jgi:transposase-like protein
VQATIQTILDEELERLVGAGPYERSDQRVGVRNVRYDRHVVSRTRGGRAATAPLGRYARRQAEVDA